MTETWTYVSPLQVQISGDVTNKYYVGQLVRITQTTDKFFIISEISYSSPNTTITLASGGLYTLANDTITAHYVSDYAAPTNPAPPFAFGLMAMLYELYSWECRATFGNGTFQATNTDYELQYVTGDFDKSHYQGFSAIYFEADLYQDASGSFLISCELTDGNGTVITGSEISASVAQWDHSVQRSGDISAALGSATVFQIKAKTASGGSYQVIQPRLVVHYGAV